MFVVLSQRVERESRKRWCTTPPPEPYINTPVAASCALPGVMAPAKLRTKNSDGVQELFEVDGVEWIDGSVQADLPFKRSFPVL